jgi:branched-chain amino acid transport system permease protein
MRRVSDKLGPIGSALVAALVVAAAGTVLSFVLPGYFVFIGTSAIVAAVALLGLGVVTGSAGMISLCQLSFAAIGAWIMSELSLLRFPGGPLVWLACGAMGAGLVGLLVGLPALRLRGVNLAVVTIGFAAAVDELVALLGFPGAKQFLTVSAPPGFTNDRSFFLLAALLLAVSVFAIQLLRGTRTGSGWVFLAFSERGLATAGASVVLTKLSAFAVSATLGGLSGGIVTMQVGLTSSETFVPLQSLALYVLSIVVGSHLVDMAVFGGILFVAIPEILKRLGVPQDWGLVLFGVLGVQALASKSNLGQTIRDALRHRRGPLPAPVPLSHPPTATPRTIEKQLLDVRNLGVAFGATRALQDVDLDLSSGQVHALIGPNGAGKSTLVDALSGFLPHHTGTIVFDGTRLGRSSPTRIARLGLRRTYQQDRVPTGLSVGAYVRFVAGRRVTREELDDLLAFFDCPAAATPLTRVDVGSRRLVEVAAQVASRPRLLLLDEPAAGLSHEGHIALGDRLGRVAARYGTALLLIEHDLDLVRQVCPTVTVLDFGRVLAEGPQESTLASTEVARAYMGETLM